MAIAGVPLSGADCVEPIRVDTIIVKGRLRPLRDDLVSDLLSSIQQVGLIHPITIRHPNARLIPHLISGAHRLEAARRLGWESIPCCIIDGADNDAALLEIDENLARGELSAAERAIHVAKRKEIYLRLHPETGHGAAPGAGRGRGKAASKKDKLSSFQKDTATRTGRTDRDVRRDTARAKHIPRLAENRWHVSRPGR
jgi:hypothetical protein